MFRLREVEASVVASDARLDFLVSVFLDLGYPLRVNEVLTGDTESIDLTLLDSLSSKLDVHLSCADYRLVSELLDVSYILEVAVVRHVDRRVSPVPCIVCTVVAVEHVISHVAEILDGLFGFSHVTSELFELFARLCALEPALCLGYYGVSKSNREVLSALSLDSLNYLDRESESVLERTAVLVSSVVHVSECELVEEVTLMYSVDLNAVNTCVLAELGCLRESLNHFLDLLDGHHSRLDRRIPSVWSLTCGSAAVLDVYEWLRDCAESLVLKHLNEHVVDSHRTSESAGELDEQLGACLVELRHPLSEILEHLLVLIEPSSAHCVSDALHAREYQTYAILSTAEDVVSCLFVEMARLEPAEQGCSAHGSLYDPVRDLYVTDLPRSE